SWLSSAGNSGLAMAWARRGSRASSVLVDNMCLYLGPVGIDGLPVRHGRAQAFGVGMAQFHRFVDQQAGEIKMLVMGKIIEVVPEHLAQIQRPAGERKVLQ